MRILVTGGSGVLGRSAVNALLRRGHTVRLLARRADAAARQWREGVEPWVGDVGVANDVRGSADSCDALLHLAAIVDETPPLSTFQRINVEGTRHMVSEANAANVGKFVYVSSLGANRGGSAYHESKREGERIARTFRNEWTIVRPGGVYGPGDRHISVMLRMVRSLPVFPLVGSGDQRVQLAWHEDIAEALAQSVTRADLAGREIDIAGTEITTTAELVECIRALTGRGGVSVPIPEFMVSLGAKALESAGFDVPLSESQLQMLSEDSVIAADQPNGLEETFNVNATPLSVGLRRLLTEQAATLPSDGIGPLRRKRFWMTIPNTRMTADALSSLVRENLGDLMPAMVTTNAEPGARAAVREGETLVLALPVRGNVLVRVAEEAHGTITLLTVEGHPLAGAVRFVVTGLDDRTLFEVLVYERAAGIPDLIAMRLIGDRVQDAVWHQFMEAVARAAGAAGAEITHETEELEQEAASAIERWLEELNVGLARRANAAKLVPTPTQADSATAPRSAR